MSKAEAESKSAFGLLMQSGGDDGMGSCACTSIADKYTDANEALAAGQLGYFLALSRARQAELRAREKAHKIYDAVLEEHKKASTSYVAAVNSVAKRSTEYTLPRRLDMLKELTPRDSLRDETFVGAWAIKVRGDITKEIQKAFETMFHECEIYRGDWKALHADKGEAAFWSGSDSDCDSDSESDFEREFYAIVIKFPHGYKPGI